jgi:hypothetical protein
MMAIWSQLTESWAGVYLQVAATILVFALGFPLIVEQISISEDLRRIVHRHNRMAEWLLPLLFALATLITLCFVWFLHPVAIDFAKQDQAVLNNASNPNNNLIASLFITLIVLTPAIILRVFQVSYRRNEILSSLKQKCDRHIEEGFLDHLALEDIQYLGELGKTRGEKIQVLEILEQLAYKMQTCAYYQGRGLENIIKAIEFTLQKDTDSDSFARGVLILQHIIENISKSKFDSSYDVGLVLKTLGRLGVIAFTIDSERSARKIVETIQFISRTPDGGFLEAALALFELGVTALEHGQFLVAVEALNKLEAMTCQKEPVNVVNSSTYLGLVAHFWARGDSARQRALSGLKGIKFSPSRSKCLKSAQQSFFGTARFTTADLLSKMIAEL